MNLVLVCISKACT